MDLVLEVCVWGRGASLQPDESHEGGVGSAQGRVFASKLSASRGVGLCVRLLWPLAAFCALHVLAAKRAKADEKAAATQSTLSEHIHMDVGIHKHKLDTLMSSPRFHELPGSVVERVQVFCILSRRFFFTIRLHFHVSRFNSTFFTI